MRRATARKVAAIGAWLLAAGVLPPIVLPARAGDATVPLADDGAQLCRADPAGVAPDRLVRVLARSAAAYARRTPAVLVEILDNRGATRQIVARYDPRRARGDAGTGKPGGAKREEGRDERGRTPWVGGWRVLERNHEPVDERTARRQAKKLAHDGPPGSYGLIARYLDGEIRAVEPLGSDRSDAAPDVRWRIGIARLGPASMILKGEDLSSLIAGELDVGCDAYGPHVVAARLRLRAPASLGWLVKIRDGRANAHFGRDAKGRAILLEEHLTIDVKPFLFSGFLYETTRRYRDHRFPEAVPAGAQTGMP